MRYGRESILGVYYKHMIDFISNFIVCGILPIEVRGRQQLNNNNNNQQVVVPQPLNKAQIDNNNTEQKPQVSVTTKASKHQQDDDELDEPDGDKADDYGDDDEDEDEYIDSSYEGEDIIVVRDGAGEEKKEAPQVASARNIDIFPKVDHSAVRIYEIYGVL